MTASAASKLNIYDDLEFAAKFREALGRLAARQRLEFTMLIESGDEGLPRASSIGNCAQQQLYKLNGTEPTDVRTPVDNWAAWMGIAGQEIVRAVLAEMGYTVGPPRTLRTESMTGHTDGDITGLDFGTALAVWDSKLRNVFGFKKLIAEGQLRRADVSIYLQLMWYGAQMGASHVFVTVHPHDLSTWRIEQSRAKFHMAEPLVHRIILPVDENAVMLAEQRATGLIAAKNLGMQVYREFDPTNPRDQKFPCGYCPFMTQCIADMWDTNRLQIAPIPDAWKEADSDS